MSSKLVQKQFAALEAQTPGCNSLKNLGIDEECQKELCVSAKERDYLEGKLSEAAKDDHSQMKVYTQFAEEKLKSITKTCTMQLGGSMGEKLHTQYLKDREGKPTFTEGKESEALAIGEIVKLINNTSTIPFHRFIDLINGFIPGINKILSAENIENLNEIPYNICLVKKPKDMFDNWKGQLLLGIIGLLVMVIFVLLVKNKK